MSRAGYNCTVLVPLAAWAAAMAAGTANDPQPWDSDQWVAWANLQEMVVYGAQGAFVMQEANMEEELDARPTEPCGCCARESVAVGNTCTACGELREV